MHIRFVTCSMGRYSMLLIHRDTALRREREGERERERERESGGSSSRSEIERRFGGQKKTWSIIHLLRRWMASFLPPAMPWPPSTPAGPDIRRATRRVCACPSRRHAAQPHCYDSKEKEALFSRSLPPSVPRFCTAYLTRRYNLGDHGA